MHGGHEPIRGRLGPRLRRTLILVLGCICVRDGIGPGFRHFRSGERLGSGLDLLLSRVRVRVRVGAPSIAVNKATWRS